MMSIAVVSGSGAASSYYEVDDYYTQANADEHTQLSSWTGNGAVLQGLKGPVKPEDFKRVLDGIAPDGTELGRVVNNERQHRPGLDLTFSPPKSVAIMAQVFGDKRVVHAHNEAVKDTLQLVERFAAKARVAHGGETHKENTNNLTIATFNHTATRAQDPGMHTHSVIANMTLCDDGKWRSLFNDDIWNNSKARFGESYSMTLAKKLNELGYDIVAKGKNAEYEIAGVPKELIDHFSTRSRKIKELLDERGLAGPKNKEWATLQTREKKVQIPKELEQQAWKERANHLGHDLTGLVEKSHSQAASLSDTKERAVALESVTDAMEHLAQRSSSFTIQELIQHARNLGVGKTTDKAIFKAVEHLKEKEVLLQPSKEHPEQLTTRDTVATEIDSQIRIEAGKGLFKPMGTLEDAKRVSAMYTLNPGQARSLELVTTSRDRYGAIQGWAGVGKTHYARALDHVLQEKGIEAVGLSASAKAASELESSSGIKSNTIASFIFKHRDILEGNNATQANTHSLDHLQQKKLLIVDESSFVSSQDWNKLLQIAEHIDARVLKMGDYKQLGSVDAGAPFKQALDNGIEQERLDQIVRQENEQLKEAVYDAIDGRVSSALSKINVVENSECQAEYKTAKDAKLAGDHYSLNRGKMRDSLALQAAERFNSLTPMERANTALIVPSNALRVQVNELVRQHLVEQGEIDTKSITVDSLKNTGLTNSEMRYAYNYKEGQVVRFNTASSHFGIARDEYYHVADNSTILNQDRFLTLVSSQDPDKSIVIHPKELASRGERGVEVFNVSKRELAAGDVIRWTRNDKFNGIVNTEKAYVLNVDTESNSAEVLLNNKETRTLDMGQLSNCHLDYNFANTVHAAQGATVKNVITVAESWHKLLTKQDSFYVQISRAKNEVELITDDKALLESQLTKDPQNSDIALDLYNQDEKPLDFDLIAEIRENLMDGAKLKELYLDLVVALDGDRLGAQQHLQALGVDVQGIESSMRLSSAANEYFDSAVPSLANQDGSEGAAKDGNSIPGDEKDKSGMDWSNFDDLSELANENVPVNVSERDREIDLDL